MARSERPRCRRGGMTTKIGKFLTILLGARSAHNGHEGICRISAVLPGALSAHNGQEGEMLLGAAQRRREINGAFGRLTSVGSRNSGAKGAPRCPEALSQAWGCWCLRVRPSKSTTPRRDHCGRDSLRQHRRRPRRAACRGPGPRYWGRGKNEQRPQRSHEPRPPRRWVGPGWWNRRRSYHHRGDVLQKQRRERRPRCPESLSQVSRVGGA